ncbi:MAG: methylated-DNA--[protein]-cysteine S-methyltransferase [Halieaceae bacterium]
MRVTTPYKSPFGILEIEASDEGISAIRWPSTPDDKQPHPPITTSSLGRPESPLLETAKTQLDEYFQGARNNFELPLSLTGTPFQQLVWNALKAIPYGTTKSYGAIANAIDRPRAVRAVGRAIGSNPIPLIIPCHRVIGAGGKLTGFSGGLDRKRWLLNREDAVLAYQ